MTTLATGAIGSIGSAIVRRLLHYGHMFFSHAKAHRELGYRPKPADVALRDAVRLFMEDFEGASS